jgi:hypothetical protein
MSVSPSASGRTRSLSFAAAVVMIAAVFIASALPVELSAADGGARPDYSVDVSGDIAVVGASWEAGYSGAAYVLRRDGDAWAVEQRLVPSDLGEYDHFGQSVRIEGDRIIVSSPWHDLQRGAAYEFIFDNGVWVQDRKISAPKEAVAGKPHANMLLLGGPPIDESLPAGAEDLIYALENETGSSPPLMAPAALEAPEWVSATDGIFEDRVEITWQNTGLDAVIYKVHRDDELIALVPSNLSRYSDEEVTIGVSAHYCVVVSDMVAEESDSTCDNGARIIFKPTSFTASNGQYLDGVHLSWVDISAINDGYYIKRDSELIDSTGAGESYYIDTGVAPGRTPYNYEVAAYVNGGYLSASVSDSGWRGEKLPPYNVSATDGQYQDRVIITWKSVPDSLDAVETTGFNVYRRGYLIGSTADSIKTFVDSTVVYGVLYDYCISSVGTGDIESIRICDDGNAGLETPDNVSASDSTYDDRIRITWVDMSDSEDGYEIVRDVYVSSGTGKNDKRPIVTASLDSVIVGTVGRDVQTFDDMTAEPGVTYLYYVRATSLDGGISLPGEDTGYRSVVLAPTNVQATDGDFEGRTGITWESASATASSFLIFRDSSLIKTLDASNRYYNDEGGVAGFEYIYSVKAMTAMGEMSTRGSDPGYRELKQPSMVDASDDEYENRVVVTWSDNSAIEDGYRIYRREYDESGVLRGFPAGSIVMPTVAHDVVTDGRYAYVTDEVNGLQIISISDPSDPVLLGSIDTPDFAQGIDIAGNYAYVADGDAGLQVIDISDPRNPRIVGNYNAAGHVRDVAVSGDYAYLVEDGYGLHIVDISDPADPDPKGAIGTIGNASGIAIYGDYAYVSVYSPGGLRIINISDPEAPSMHSFYISGYPGNCVSLYGNYAVIGTDRSVEIIDFGDVASPANPPTLAGTFGTFGEVLGIDIEGDIAYVPDDTGLKAIDISDPPSPTESWSLAISDFYRGGVAVTESSICLISETHGLQMISLVGEIIDSIEPNRTSFVDYSAVSGVSYTYSIAAYDSTSSGIAGESPHSVDEGVRTLIAPTMVSASDGLYEDRVEITWRDKSDYEDGYYIYRDDSLIDSLDYNTISYTDYSSEPGIRYEYSIAAFDSIGPSESVADIGYTTLLPPVSFHASDFYDDRIELDWVTQSEIATGYIIFQDGVPIDTLTGIDQTSSTLHFIPGVFLDAPDNYYSNYDGPTPDVAVAGNYAYLASGYSGLRVIDISDPSNPVIVGNCDTPGYVSRVVVAGNYAYIADGWGGGLRVVDVSTPGAPFLVGYFATPADSIRGVAVDGDYAYVTSANSGGLLQVIDVSSPSLPGFEGSCTIPGAARDIAVEGEYAYVADGSTGIQVIDISSTAPPQLIATEDTPGDAQGIVVAGDYAYVADGSSGLQVIDVSNPLDPEVIGTSDSPGNAIDVAVTGDYAYVADTTPASGLHIINISTPDTPAVVRVETTPEHAQGIAVTDSYICVSCFGLQLNPLLAPGIVYPGVTYEFYVEAYSGALTAQSEKDFGSIYIPEPPDAAVVTELTQKLLASDGADGDEFGYRAVAVNGDWAVVGAWKDDVGSYESGSAYVFKRNADGTWPETETQKLVLADPSAAHEDEFGYSAAISENHIFIGTLKAEGGGTDRGAIYIFERNPDDTWGVPHPTIPGAGAQSASFNADDANDEGRFGISVAIDGDWAVVGASNGNGNTANSGTAYIFKYDTLSGYWAQYQEIYSSDGATDDAFGYDVVIDGGRIVVGAPAHDVGAYEPGAAYVFEQNPDGTWPVIETQKLLAAGPQSYTHQDGFGGAVGISGDYIIVSIDGADASGTSGGAVAMFERNPDGTWGLEHDAVEDARAPNQSIYASDGAAYDEFGQAVAISGERAIVSAFNDDVSGEKSGSAYIIERNVDGVWTETQKLIASDGAAEDRFGMGVGLNGDQAIIGVWRDDDNGTNSGSAFIVDFGASAYAVAATDGTLNSRVRVTWDDRSPNERGFRIYRDGDNIASVESNVEVYEDFDAEPGRTYVYSVATVRSDLSEEGERGSDYGWRPANGNITGRISTPEGAVSDSIQIAVSPLRKRALLFDGSGGYISVSDPDDAFNFNINQSFTVEMWVKYAGDGGSGSGDGTMIAKSSAGWLTQRYPFSIGNMRSDSEPGRIRFRLGDGTGSPAEVSSADETINDNSWHHIACVHDAALDSIYLFVDGLMDTSEAASGLGDITNSAPLSFGAGEETDSWFGGQLDEVRIWNVARNAADIREAMYVRLEGNEQGLVAFWPFDEGTLENSAVGNINKVITDFASGSHYGVFLNGVYWTNDNAPLDYFPMTDAEGNYVINELYYGTEEEFEVRPFSGNRQFDPAVKRVVLTTESPVENQVNFIDISSYTVSGTIRFAGTECPAVDIPIIVDDEPAGVTDKHGYFAVSVDEGTHVIKPVYGKHIFEPDNLELFVENDIDVDDSSGVTFSDVTTYTLSGQIGGGCGNRVGDITIAIRSENNCLLAELPYASTDSVYYSIELPPQNYYVSASIDPQSIPDRLSITDVVEYFQNLGARQAAMDSMDVVLDFVYRAPLRVAITGFEGYVETCDGPLGFDGRTFPDNLPVIPQNEPLFLTIEVNEDYGAGGLCPLESGTVTIYDEIYDGRTGPFELTVLNGVAQLRTWASTPSVIVGRVDEQGNDRSFQKSITAVVDVEGRTPVTASEWVLVTGHVAPEGADYIAGAVDIPLYILRDPPGDRSFSVLEKGQKIKTTVIWENNEDFFGKGLFIDLWTGVEVEWFVGLGGGFIKETSKSISSIETDWIKGTTEHTEDRTDITCTMKKTFSTSSDDLFVGGGGDVFIGVGYNFIVSEVDVIGIDTGNCEVTKGISVGFQPDTIETIYAYTNQFINETLIPDLENLSSYYDSLYKYSGNKLYTDSAMVMQREADRWNRRLHENDSLKLAATAPERVVENRSFSSGADFTYTYENDSTISHTFTEAAVTDGDILFGNLGIALPWGMALNISGHTKHHSEGFEYGEDDDPASWDSTWTQTVSYTLSDGDIGDHFTVNIGYDDTYPSPVFDVIAGVSSCPYEPWPVPLDPDSIPRMLSRDMPDLSILPPERHAIPPDEAAVFTLNMANLSPSNESRRYVLRVLNQYNPYGAVIKVGQYPIYDGLEYFIEPGQSQEVTVTVERGPSKYNYENLALFMYAPCEYLLWEKNGTLQLADTVFFDVTFEAPCSEITMTLPESGWIYSKNSLDADPVVPVTMLLSRYEWQLSEDPDDTIQSIGFGYRRLGSGEEGPSEWIDTPVASPGPAETLIEWYPPASLEDGVYELRGFTKCAGGNGYSEVSTGTIDIRGPQVFGTPEPSDGVLSFGEDISITFNELIARASVDPDSVTMTYLDWPTPPDPEITFETVCGGNTVVITPTTDPGDLEGRRIRVIVTGVTDRLGNPMAEPAVWEFDYRKSQFAWSDAGIVGETAFGTSGGLSAELVNGTSAAVEFVFTELPAWIVGVTPLTGTVLPGEKQSVTFTIQSDLATGSYHDEVRVEADDGSNVSVAILTIDLTVGECAAPAWAVNPNMYEHSMSIVAELDIGGISEDRMDMLAAFVGGELRGVTSVDSFQVNTTEQWLVFLTVYSNRPAGETVRFQIWDDSDCRLYNAADKSYPFVAESTIGTPDEPETLAALDVAGGEVLAIEVREGWNWISTNIWTPDMGVTNILADLNLAPGDLIKSQTEFSQFIDDPDPEIYPAWVPSFDLDNVSGYLLNLSQPGTIIHTGAPVSVDSIIPVVQYWNWIGYLPAGPMSVGAALDNLAFKTLMTNDDIIKGQYGFAQYLDGTWYGSLTEMEPGRAYKLYLEGASPTPGTDWFNYPAYAGSPPEPPVAVAAAEAGEQASESEAVAAGEEAAAAPDWSVNPYAYQFNMTMTAVVRVDGLETADGRDIVGAFVGGECRGLASPEYISGLRRYEAFLMIHSNEPSGETVEFRVFDADAGTVCRVTEKVDWTADAVVGTVTQPFVLSAVSGGEEDGGVPKAYALGQNVPNPFNPSTTIWYDVPAGGGNVSLRIYDVSGRLVRVLVDGHQAEGSRSVTWDGTGDRGTSLASGVYFYRMTAPGFDETKKMVLLR